MKRAATALPSLLLLVAVAVALSACGGDVTAGGVSGEEPGEGTDELRSIVDRAAEAGNLATLSEAITKAGLEDTLKGKGPFTVFAPTDDAFAALPKGALDKLLADPQGKLSEVLKYHVVPGEVTSMQLTDGLRLETLQGKKLTVSVDDEGNVKIDDATLVSGDTFASNGVIHTIDAVLLPAQKD